MAQFNKFLLALLLILIPNFSKSFDFSYTEPMVLGSSIAVSFGIFLKNKQLGLKLIMFVGHLLNERLKSLSDPVLFSRII